MRGAALRCIVEAEAEHLKDTLLRILSRWVVVTRAVGALLVLAQLRPALGADEAGVDSDVGADSS